MSWFMILSSETTPGCLDHLGGLHYLCWSLVIEIFVVAHTFLNQCNVFLLLWLNYLFLTAFFQGPSAHGHRLSSKKSAFYQVLLNFGDQSIYCITSLHLLTQLPLGESESSTLTLVFFRGLKMVKKSEARGDCDFKSKQGASHFSKHSTSFRHGNRWTRLIKMELIKPWKAMKTNRWNYMMKMNNRFWWLTHQMDICTLLLKWIVAELLTSWPEHDWFDPRKPTCHETWTSPFSKRKKICQTSITLIFLPCEFCGGLV